MNSTQTTENENDSIYDLGITLFCLFGLLLMCLQVDIGFRKPIPILCIPVVVFHMMLCFGTVQFVLLVEKWSDYSKQRCVHCVYCIKNRCNPEKARAVGSCRDIAPNVTILFDQHIMTTAPLDELVSVQTVPGTVPAVTALPV